MKKLKLRWVSGAGFICVTIGVGCIADNVGPAFIIGGLLAAFWAFGCALVDQ